MEDFDLGRKPAVIITQSTMKNVKHGGGSIILRVTLGPLVAFQTNPLSSQALTLVDGVLLVESQLCYILSII